MVGRRRGDGGRRGPGTRAIVGSLAMHGLVVVIFWLTGLTYASPLPPMKTYAVNIVSPPPEAQGPLQEEVVADPEPPRPKEVESPPVAEDPVTAVLPESPPPKEDLPKKEPPKEDPPKEAPPKETPPDPERTEKREESKPPETRSVEKTATGADPKEDAAERGSGLNIKIDGELFPYPGYLERIAQQIGRFFRWTGDNRLSAELYFEIMRDGSVRGIRLLRGSGNAAFNLEAMSAIEQAGKRRAFGPLPEGYEEDRLPVSFYFQPAR